MDLPTRHPTSVPLIKVPIEPPPPPDHPISKPRPSPLPISIDQTPRPIPLPLPNPVQIDRNTPINIGPVGGGATEGTSIPPMPPIALPVHHDARLLTPPSELRPPYPPSKILSEEETTLRLKLTISDTGRVIAVDPVGVADREFLDAARRYLLAHWRYEPASDDGRAVTSSTVITLRFQLDG